MGVREAKSMVDESNDLNRPNRSQELFAKNEREDLESAERPKMYREADAGDGTERKDQVLTGVRWALCSFSVLLCMFLVALDQLIMAAVLTTISNHFNGFNKVTWITAAFMLPMGCLSQFWGRLSISFGRKWVMLFGVVFFEIGSIVCAVANSMNMLIGGRALQGVGSSAVQTCAMIILTEITTMDRKPFVFALVGSTFAIASSIGPIVGGLLGAYTTWRWCFYVNLICGAFIIPLFLFTYRPKPPQMSFKEKIRSVNYLDNFLLTASTVLLLVAISLGQTSKSWGTAGVIACFVIGGLLFIAFFWYNFNVSAHACIPRDIGFNKNIFVAWGSCIFSYGSFMVVIQFLSVYLQNVLGHNSFHTGIGLLPIAITCSIVSVANGIIVQKTGMIKEFAFLGCLFFTLSCGLFLLFDTHENVGYLIGFQIINGIGGGQSMQSTIMAGLVQAPQTPGSSILTTAYMTFGSRMAAAFFSEIADAIYTATLKSGLGYIASEMDDQAIPLQELVVRTSLLRSLNTHDEELVLHQIMKGVKNVFYLCLAMSTMSLVFCAVLSNRRLPKKEEVEDAN